MKIDSYYCRFRAHSEKIPTATPNIFGVKRFTGDTADVIGHRCVLEIQDVSQITGSTKFCETMTYLIKIPTAYLVYPTMTNSQEV